MFKRTYCNIAWHPLPLLESSILQNPHMFGIWHKISQKPDYESRIIMIIEMERFWRGGKKNPIISKFTYYIHIGNFVAINVWWNFEFMLKHLPRISFCLLIRQLRGKTNPFDSHLNNWAHRFGMVKWKNSKIKSYDIMLMRSIIIIHTIYSPTPNHLH